MSSGSIGNQGLSDDQAVMNRDPGMPTYQLSGAQTGTVSSGALSVSAWESVSAACQLSVGATQFLLFWYADQALTNWMGQVSIFMDSNVFAPMQMLVPNLGPWLKVQHQPAGAQPNFTPNTNVMPTNRSSPEFLVPSGIEPITKTPAIPAGGTVNLYTFVYVSGKVAIYTTGGSQGVNLQLQVQITSLLYVVVDTWSVAAGAQDYRERILPGSTFRIVTTNQSGAVANNTSTVQVTSSLSGAA